MPILWLFMYIKKLLLIPWQKNNLRAYALQKMGVSGLEPETFSMSLRRSNQLSYTPTKLAFAIKVDKQKDFLPLARLERAT